MQINYQKIADTILFPDLSMTAARATVETAIEMLRHFKTQEGRIALGGDMGLAANDPKREVVEAVVFAVAGAIESGGYFPGIQSPILKKLLIQEIKNINDASGVICQTAMQVVSVWNQRHTITELESVVSEFEKMPQTKYVSLISRIIQQTIQILQKTTHESL